nr:hypothetical protein [Candidatus Njordarchaeum guaymaensis]
MEWYIAVIEAVMMLFAWSLLYRENPFYRLGEHLCIGLYLGFTLHMGIDVLLKRVFVPLATGKGTTGLVMATILGLLFYTRYVKPAAFLGRWSTGVLMGVGSGVAVMGAIKPMIVGQLEQGSWFAPGMKGFNNFVMTVATASTIAYFLFTYKPVGWLRHAATVGRVFLMACFGVTLGTFLLSNIGFPIGMLMKLVVPPGVYVSLLAVAVMAFDVVSGRKRPATS